MFIRFPTAKALEASMVFAALEIADVQLHIDRQQDDHEDHGKIHTIIGTDSLAGSA